MPRPRRPDPEAGIPTSPPPDGVPEERTPTGQGLELAREIGRCMAREDPLEVRLERCIAALVKQLDLSFCGVWGLDAGSEPGAPLLSLVSQAGTPPSSEGLEHLIGQGEVRCAFERGPSDLESTPSDPVLSSRVWGDRRMAGREVLPLCSDGRVLGVLAAYAERPLAEPARAAIRSVSTSIALALDAARVQRERESFRDVFVWMLGHDLRNPLNAISIGAHLLSLSEELPEATARVARNMQKSTQRIGRMITQLLDFVGVRAAGAGSVSVQLVPADLREACVRALQDQRERFPERDVVDAYEGDMRGLWDIERLTQLFGTLLGNALRHGDEGTPVRLEVERRGERVLARVHNHGSPIPDRDQVSILDPFCSPGRVKGAGSEGLGIGLYLAQQIARAHAGDLSVSSSGEEGTTFSVWLPVDPSRA